MSLQQVAELAGVSASTVSRVVNERPSVAPETVASVRLAIEKLNFTPVPRRGAGRKSSLPYSKTTNIAFLVIGGSRTQTAPAFESLLRGVSGAVGERELNLIFSFITDLDDLPPTVDRNRVDGVLLHGQMPSPELRARLEKLPTVWLMANAVRPAWGDQVMPDNVIIGEIAAKYLIEKGHKHIAYVGVNSSWSFLIRAMAFSKTAADAGVECTVFQDAPATPSSASGPLSTDAAEMLVRRLAAHQPRPTGIFVAEDRLLPGIDRALSDHGLIDGSAGSLELISCNNERPHRVGLASHPAEIDIRVESIGRRGVEQLLWRLTHPDVPERFRLQVEPMLIRPQAIPADPKV